MIAAWYNPNPEVCEVLVQAGAKLNARDKDGWTPLIFAAAFSQSPAILEALLSAGADPKARDLDGKTALDHAKENEAMKGTDAFWKLNDATFN